MTVRVIAKVVKVEIVKTAPVQIALVMIVIAKLNSLYE